MARYRATFINKILESVAPAGSADPGGDTILEGRTGDTMYATIEAADDNAAQEKARRLETELQTGMTKEQLAEKENSY